MRRVASNNLCGCCGLLVAGHRRLCHLCHPQLAAAVRAGRVTWEGLEVVLARRQRRRAARRRADRKYRGRRRQPAG